MAHIRHLVLANVVECVDKLCRHIGDERLEFARPEYRASLPEVAHTSQEYAKLVSRTHITRDVDDTMNAPNEALHGMLHALWSDPLVKSTFELHHDALHIAATTRQ